MAGAAVRRPRSGDSRPRFTVRSVFGSLCSVGVDRYYPGLLAAGPAGQGGFPRVPQGDHLQWTMMQMFGDFDEWSIGSLDNVLLLANDQDDACKKLQMFLER